MATKRKASPGNQGREVEKKIAKVEKVAHAPKACLKVDKNQLERQPFPYFKRPKELAILSTRKNPNIVGSDPNKSLDMDLAKYTVDKCATRTLTAEPVANLMVLVVPPRLDRVNFDLNVGYGTQVEKDRENEFMDILLECLTKENLVGRSEFVCWRGLLTKIGSTPYDVGGKFDDGLKICVQKVAGVFYMYEFPTEDAMRNQEEKDERQKKMQYWGMKFESYVTAKSGDVPAPQHPMDFNYEFGSVVESKLGSHSLLFGGEVDCCRSEDKTRYIELKTTREFEHESQQRSFRKFKLIKWWLQSFLIGIDDIFCGFRDDNGVVKRCDWLKVSQIPSTLKQDWDHCKPSACFAFIDSFLNYVKSNVVTDLEPYVISRSVGRLEFNIDKDISGDHKFLPYWFVKNIAI